MTQVHPDNDVSKELTSDELDLISGGNPIDGKSGILDPIFGGGSSGPIWA